MEGLYTVKLLGKDRDIYFGMPAVEYVQTNVDKSAFARMGKGAFASKDIGVIAHFLFAGLMGGADLNAQNMDVTYKQAYAEVEKMMFEGDSAGISEAIGKAFSESITVKYLAKQNKGGKGPKKK